MFNLLTARVDLTGLEVLDLFAGTGNLGLEALSRGASKATFVEKARKVVWLLRKNIDLLGVNNICNIIQKPVESYLRQAVHEFDIIFSDPPYDYERIEFLVHEVKNVARTDTIWLFEHSTDIAIPPLPDWHQEAQKSYGRTTVSMFRFTGFKEEK